MKRVIEKADRKIKEYRQEIESVKKAKELELERFHEVVERQDQQL